MGIFISRPAGRAVLMEAHPLIRQAIRAVCRRKSGQTGKGSRRVEQDFVQTACAFRSFCPGSAVLGFLSRDGGGGSCLKCWHGALHFHFGMGYKAVVRLPGDTA